MLKGFIFQLVLIGLLILSVFGTANADAPGVVLVLDCSQSMQRTLDTRPAMETARPAALRFVKDLPKDSLVGVVAYGQHAANGCDDVEVLVPLGPYDRKTLISTIKKVQSQGKSPLTTALRKAYEQVSGLAQGGVIALITDGGDDCWGDPVSFIRDTKFQGAGLQVNVIGVSPNHEDESLLRGIARASDGTYMAGNTREDLILKAAEVAEKAPKVNPFAKNDRHRPRREHLKHQDRLDKIRDKPFLPSKSQSDDFDAAGQFEAQFVDLPGWNGSQVSIQDYTGNASMLIARQTHTKNRAQVTTIVKAGMSGIASNPFSVAERPDMTDEGVKRTSSKIRGFSVENIYDKRGNRGCVSVILHKDQKAKRHALLALVYKNIDPDRALELARSYDWDTLKNATRDYKVIVGKKGRQESASAQPAANTPKKGTVVITVLKHGKAVPARVRFFRRGTMDVVFSTHIPGQEKAVVKAPYGKYDVGIKPRDGQEMIEANVDIERGKTSEMVMRF